MTTETDTEDDWADHMTKGELRRLYYHLTEAKERLRKVNRIVERRNLTDSDTEFVQNVAESHELLESPVRESRNAYDER